MSIQRVDAIGKALERTDFARFSPRPKTANIPFTKLILNDPDAQGAVRIIVNALVKNGYNLEGAQSDKYVRMLEKKYRFRRYLRMLAWDLSIYGNHFVELVGLDANGEGTVQELNPLDIPQVELLEEPNGVVYGYKVTNPNNGETTEFTTQQVLHFAWDRFGGYNWGVSPFQSLTGILRAKGTLQSYANWMFETNQFRTHFNLAKGTKDQKEDFVASIEASKRDPYKSLVTQGEVSAEALRDFKDLSELRNFLEYYSNEINLVNQVSPIQAGVVEGTNRSSGDIQVRFNFMNNIQAKQESLEYDLKYELLPLLGVPESYEFTLNTSDVKAELDFITTAEKLYNMGADMDKVNSWLINRGVSIPEDLFPDREEPVEDERNIAQNSDSFPSRRGQDSLDRNQYQADGAVDE